MLNEVKHLIESRRINSHILSSIVMLSEAKHLIDYRSNSGEVSASSARCFPLISMTLVFVVIM